MSRGAYLTIDDGPSSASAALIDFLYERRIPAIFFNRGDAMEQRPEAALAMIRKGFIVANHAYSHRRTSNLPLEEVCTEILKTERIIEDLYARTGVARPGKYFRFPYMDRGMGPWLAEPDGLAERHKAAHIELLQQGLGHRPAIPGLCQIDKKRKLQTFLKEQGFTPVPFQGVTISWYAESEMAAGIDALCTYSTGDWALSARHKGKHSYETLADLEAKIDADPWLRDRRSRHIVLVHDQAEILPVTTGLIEAFLKRDFEFLSSQ